MSQKHDDLPPPLRQRLEESDRAHLFVPPEVDEAVLDAARRRFAEIRRRRRRPRRWARWLGPAAAAAAVGLMVWAVNPSATRQAPPPATAQRSQPVTILDAFALARRRGAGDATVSQSQIDRLAFQAVRLPRAAKPLEDTM
jgi:hypothetical protein